MEVHYSRQLAPNKWITGSWLQLQTLAYQLGLIYLTPANEIRKYSGDADSTSRLSCISVPDDTRISFGNPIYLLDIARAAFLDTRTSTFSSMTSDFKRDLVKWSMKAHAANARTT